MLSTGPDQLRNVNSEIPDWRGRWAPVCGWAWREDPVLQWFLQLCRIWPAMGLRHPPALFDVWLRVQEDCYRRNGGQGRRYNPCKSGRRLCRIHRTYHSAHSDPLVRSVPSARHSHHVYLDYYPRYFPHCDCLGIPDSRHWPSAVCVLPSPSGNALQEADLSAAPLETPTDRQSRSG